MNDSPDPTSPNGDRAAFCTAIEPWLQEHGVPQFVHRYSARDRLPLLLFLLLTIFAFEVGAGPWLGKVSAYQLLLAPLVLICVGLWASPALAVLIDLRRTSSTSRRLSGFRLVALGAAVYLLARSNLPPPYADPWVDFLVLFFAAAATAVLSSRTLWAQIEGTHPNAGRGLIAMMVLAVLAFAVEGSVFPQFDAMIDPGLPQALPALAVVIFILVGALRLSRTARRSEVEVSSSDGAVAAYVPAVPLLVLVFGGETAVLPHAAADGWQQAVWPVALLVALASVSVVGARRAARPSVDERLRAAVSGREVVLWWIAAPFVLTYPLLVFFYVEIDMFGTEVEGLPAFLVTAAINLFYFLVAVLAVTIGLDRIAVWAGREARSNVRGIGEGLARGVPLLLVFTVFFFLQAELWQVVIRSGTLEYLVLVGILVVPGLVVLLLLSVRQLRAASSFVNWWYVRHAALGRNGTENLAPGDERFRNGLAELARSQRAAPQLKLNKLGWFNAGAIVTVYQAFIFVPVTIAAWILFFVLGHLLVSEEVATEWIYGDNATARDVATLDKDFGNDPWSRVAFALAAFSFLYLVVDTVWDPGKRSDFFGAADRAIRQRFAIRLAYATLVPAVERDRLRSAGLSLRRPGAEIGDRVGSPEAT